MELKTNINEFDNQLHVALKDAYDGSGGFITGNYLERFIKEDVGKFNNRKRLAYYDNNFASIIDAYTNPIASKAFSFTGDSAPEELDLFLDNCDGTGKTFREFKSDIDKKAEMHGFCCYFFDAECDEVRSKQEQIESKIYPKIFKINPDKIINNYRINSRGEVVFLQFYRPNQYNINEIWTYKRGLLSEKKEIIDAKANKKTEVITEDYGENGYFINPKGKHITAYSPVFTYSLDHADEPTSFPSSSYLSTLTQTIAVYRLDNVGMYQTHDATFGLFVTDDTNIDKKKFVLSENNVIQVSPERYFKSLSTEYIADKIDDKSAKIKENMFQDKNLSVNISSQASGISREYADKLYVSALQDKSKKAEREENKIIDIFYTFIKGVERGDDDYYTSYPQEFAPNSETVMIDRGEKLINQLSVAPENAMLIRQKLLAMYFSNSTNEEIQQIFQNEKNYTIDDEVLDAE